jgi:hypothetical protein
VNNSAAMIVVMSLILGLFGISAGPVRAGPICGHYGADADCGTIITINNDSSVVSTTGQGPYDGADDTLVGVVNNSQYSIKSIDLSSGFTLFGVTFGSTNIFGFDGDGVNTYGSPGTHRMEQGMAVQTPFFPTETPLKPGAR